MTDEDPKSLMSLCDDTILQILSLINLKKRVRHSRTSKRMADLVDESLAGVRSLPEDWTFSDKRESRMKTLSKLKNLRRMDASSFSVDSEIVSVMVENCQKLEHISHWTLDKVNVYVSRLQAKGVAVRLKTITAKNCLSFCRRDSLSSVLQKSSAKLILDCEDFAELMARDSTPVDFAPRVTEVSDWDSTHLNALHIMLPNIQKITNMGIQSEDEMRRLLHSAPNLKHIGFRCKSTQKLLQLLADAKQEFTGIDNVTTYAEADAVSDETVRLLLQRKGQNLRHLQFSYRPKGEEPGIVSSIIQTMIQSCPHLQSFLFLRWGKPAQIFKYSSRRLTLHLTRTVSLVPLFTLFPRTKDVKFGFPFIPKDAQSLTTIPDLRMQELRDFASRQKKYCINAKIRDPRSTVVSFDHNLRFTR